MAYYARGLVGHLSLTRGLPWSAPHAGGRTASLPSGSLEKVAKEGVMFCTYSLLIHGSGKVADMAEKGCAVDPEQLIKPGSRLRQLVDWLSKDPEGPLVIFDECHKAKNLINDAGQPTKTALAVPEPRS